MQKDRAATEPSRDMLGSLYGVTARTMCSLEVFGARNVHAQAAFRGGKNAQHYEHTREERASLTRIP